MKRPMALAAVALFGAGYLTASLVYQADYDEARLSKQECEDELDRLDHCGCVCKGRTQ